MQTENENENAKYLTTDSKNKYVNNEDKRYGYSIVSITNIRYGTTKIFFINTINNDCLQERAA